MAAHQLLIVHNGVMTPDGLERAGVTAREAEVLSCMEHRPTNAEVAAELFISLRTVESHVSSLLRKLQVSGRRELAALAEQLATSGSSGLAAPLASIVDPQSFHGREVEMDALSTAWAATANGHRSTHIVLGEAGIGKSRLIAEFSRRVADEAPTLFGACFEERGAAFEPVLTAVRSLTIDLDDAVLTQRQRNALVGHVPRLHGSSLNDATGSLSDASDGLASLLVASIARPTLMVLEDVHWADPSGWEAVLAVLRRPESVPLMVVVTSRNTAPDLDVDLARRLSVVESVPGVGALELGGLGDAAVAALRPELKGTAVDDVIASTGGNPLLVIAQTDTGLGPLDTMLDRRFDRLSANDVDLVDLATVIGAEFSLSLLADAAGISVLDSIDSMERAADAGIVQSHPGRPGINAFRHALFRSLRHKKLSPRRRIEANAAIAKALVRQHGDPLVLARHACGGVPVIDPAHAVEMVLAAGRLAAVHHDPSIAAALYGDARVVFDLAGGIADELRLAIVTRHGEALCLLDEPEGREALTDAAALAEQLGRGDLMCDAVASMVTIPGGAYDPMRSAPTFVRLCRRALEVHGSAPSSHRVRVLGVLGLQLLLGEGRLDEGRKCVAAALAEAERVGDRALASALLNRRYTGTEPDRIAEGLLESDRMIELGERLDDPVLYDAGSIRRAFQLLFSGDVALAEQVIDHLPEGGAPYTRVEKLNQQAFAALVRGDLSKARTQSDELQQLAAAAGTYSLMTRAVPCAAIIEGWTQGWSALRSYADLLGGIAGFGASVLSGLAAVGLAGAGERDRVGEVAESNIAALEQSLASRHPVAGVALATFGLAVAAADLGHLTEPLIGHLEPYEGLIVGIAYPIMTADGIRADLLRAGGDPLAAVDLARRSIATSRQRGTPVFEAYEMLVLAHALRDAGEPDNIVYRVAAQAKGMAERLQASVITHELTRRGLVQQ